MDWKFGEVFGGVFSFRFNGQKENFREFHLSRNKIRNYGLMYLNTIILLISNN